MTHARTMVLAGALLALAAAACASGSQASPAGATPARSAAPTQAGSAAASAPASASGAASAAATGGATPAPATAAPASGATSAPTSAASAGASVGVPSILDRHSAPDLEAQLPDVVAGTTLSKYSLTLAELLEDQSADRATITAFVERLGKTIADAAVAAAYDATGRLDGAVQAYRISGADPAALLAGMVSVAQSDLGADAAIREATIAGKSVTVVSVGTAVNDTQWLYSRGDIVFVVHTQEEATATLYLMALD